MTQKTELSLVAVNLVNDGSNWLQVTRISDLSPIESPAASDAGTESLVNSHTSHHVLGFVALNSMSIKLDAFRGLMAQQIQTLPDSFIFLSKEGWPVSSIQEMNLNLYYIINNDHSMVMIRRQFDKHRFGVQSMNGLSIGFIFAQLEDTGQEIRRVINQELSVVANEDETFQLIDRNGWPVSLRQEQVIKGWDLVLNGVFRISGIKRSAHDDIPDMPVENVVEVLQSSPIRKKKRPSEATTIDLNKTLEDSSSHNIMSIVPVHTNPELATPPIPSAASVYHPSVSISEAKPLLISYVRAEAEQHARQLKSELQDLGCNVFLDVDEIEGGHDWADALNNAVLNCDLFVPLITPNYGYTQWTNREVKLADIKKKQIVPISFLDSWPPECLAIQFASTQYIPWKTNADIDKSIAKGEGDRARDIRFWDQPYVRQTARTIAEHLRIANLEKERLTTQIIATPNPSLDALSIPMNIQGMNIPALEMPNHLQFASDYPIRPTTLMALGAPPKRRPISVVISVHPAEKQFASDIRQELTKFGYDVWCSTDMSFGCYSSSTENLMTPSFELTPSTPMNERLEDCDQMSEQTLYIGSQGQYSDQSSQDSQTPNDARRALNRQKLQFNLSMSDPMSFPQCSQDFGSQACILSPEDLNKAKSFRERVEAASLVIVILSKAYCHSRTCKQQAFYCNIRKRIIPVKYDDFRPPHWLSKLFDENDEELIEHNPDDTTSFMQRLTHMTSKLVASSKDTFKCAMSEARIQSMATFVGRSLPIKKKEIMVYVSGSSKFFNPESEAICRAIGHTLAGIPFLVLVTGGAYGVGETTGRSFCEERGLLRRGEPSNLYHILPKYVSQDSSMKARQNQDGTFQKLPFGETLFIGDSFKERDSVVAKLFHYCIIIEGGPRTARIAEEFMWNDNIVIPVICTGGAAGGNFDLPAKIHDVPLGVHQDDWSTLVRRDVTAENVAESVKNIIYSLHKCRSARKKVKDKERHSSGFRVNKTRTNKTKSKA